MKSLGDIRGELCSVIPIPITPFDPHGRIDEPAYQRVLERLTAVPLLVLTTNGNTSEFYALSENERRCILEITTRCIGARACIVNGIGFDVDTAIMMGKFSESSGAQAVMVHQPIHPYQSAQGWVAYHRAIADALPKMGIVLYVRDPAVTAHMLVELVEKCPNVLGVKYAVPNPVQFASMVRQVGPDRVAWICGLAETWAPFFWLGGARGFTSGLANIHAPLSFQMLECLRANEFGAAMQIWARIKPFEDLRARDNGTHNVSVVKEALTQMSLCERTVRPPLCELSENDRERVREILKDWQLLPAHPV